MLILRFSESMARKIRLSPGPSLPPSPEPLLDWAAHLFRCQRYQYVIVTNTQTLFSFVCHGQGICDISSFVDIIMSTMREVFENYGFVKAFDDRLAPNAREMILTKVGDRSLTGCMNNIVGMSQFWLERDHLSPMDLQPRINEIPINRKGVKEVIVGRNELSRAIGIPDNTMPYWQPVVWDEQIWIAVDWSGEKRPRCSPVSKFQCNPAIPRTRRGRGGVHPAERARNSWQ